jgi:hypothetical protein
MYGNKDESQPKLDGCLLLLFRLAFLEFRNLLPCTYGMLEKQLIALFRDRHIRLLARHSSTKPDTLVPLCHVIVLQVEHHLLLLRLHINLRARRMCGVNRHSSARRLVPRYRDDMSTLSRLRNFWILGG